MEKSKGATREWSDNLVGAANMAMGVASAIQSVSSIIQTI
jgi:hypothetical protein